MKTLLIDEIFFLTHRGNMFSNLISESFCSPHRCDMLEWDVEIVCQDSLRHFGLNSFRSSHN